MGAAFLATEVFGLHADEIIKAMYSFEPLPHRLEFLGQFKGIEFYNDSIATIPEACIAALESIPECDSLILGGFNRGIAYEELVQYLISSNVSNLILMGEVGQILKNTLRKYNHHKKVFDAYNIQEAVEMAYKHTKEGKACLLSPAASSYDQFKNFEDRGEQYKAAVRDLGA
jgi:UDP-N-acetylmuramoylalanine--D-glutamate ligase